MNKKISAILMVLVVGMMSVPSVMATDIGTGTVTAQANPSGCPGVIGLTLGTLDFGTIYPGQIVTSSLSISVSAEGYVPVQTGDCRPAPAGTIPVTFTVGDWSNTGLTMPAPNQVDATPGSPTSADFVLTAAHDMPSFGAATVDVTVTATY